jgi:hypothetical protein
MGSLNEGLCFDQRLSLIKHPKHQASNLSAIRNQKSDDDDDRGGKATVDATADRRETCEARQTELLVYNIMMMML